MKQMKLLLLLIFGFIFSGTVVLQAATLRKGPYMIYPKVNTQMTVLWQTDTTPGNSSIEWGTTTAYGNESGALTESGNGTDEHQFSYTISGLTAATRYYYRVTVDGQQETGSFMAALNDNATSATIYAYGDTRSYPEDHNNVAAAIMDDVNVEPDNRQTLILHDGDWIYSDDESDWQEQHFNRDYSNTLDFMSKLPIMGARGNHEGIGTEFRKYWPYTPDSKFYYSFDYGPMHVIVIDQYAPYTSGSTQYNWIVNDLASSTKPFKIALFHAPGWSASTGAHSNNLTVQNTLQPLFVEHGVKLVVAGNNHYYSRVVVDGVHHLTTGGGGAELYEPESGHPNIIITDKSYHFCRFDISGGILTANVIKIDGTVIETFQITDDLNPTALNDSYTVARNTALNVPPDGVLGNDSDLEDLPLTAVIATGVSHGALTLNSDGSFDYTPNTDYNGYDSFTYQANNGTLYSNIASVDIAVGDVPVKMKIISVSDIWKYSINSTDSESTWNTLGYDDSSWESGPSGIGYADGDDATTVPDNTGRVFMRKTFNVTDTTQVTSLEFGVDYDDGYAAFINGTLVSSANAPSPITNSSLAPTDSEAIGMLTTIDITSAATPVLVNGENVLAIVVLNVFLGSSDMSMIPELSITSYVSTFPTVSVAATDTAASEEGLDTGTWTISRTGDTTDPLTVNFALSGGATYTDDYTATDTTSVTILLGQSSATVTLTPVDDSILDEGDETATLTISTDAAYTIGTGSADITIGDNDVPPVAVADSYSTGVNVALVVPAIGVLGNDSGSGLTAIEPTNPSNGDLTFNTNGSFTYTPDIDFVGTDSFTYKAHNDNGDSIATVTIEVLSPETETTSESSSRAEEDTADGSVGIGSSDLEFVYDNYGPGSWQEVGLLFALDIPQGAVIQSANIQFECDETISPGDVNLIIHAQDADDASSFTTASFDVTSRTKTTDSVAWHPAPWVAAQDKLPAQLTPDLSTLIQAVVSRDGWVSGNNIAFIISGDNGTSARIAEPTATISVIYTSAAPPPFTYALTVTGGSGGGDYESGTSVPIVADIPSEGYSFNGWTGGAGTYVDTNSAATTYTTVAANEIITAEYSINGSQHIADNSIADWSISETEVINFIGLYNSNDNSEGAGNGDIAPDRITMREVLRVIYLHNGGGNYKVDVAGGTVDGYVVDGEQPTAAIAKSDAPTQTAPEPILVSSSADSGIGSLRNAIAFAADGDTITLDDSINTITLINEILIDKSITIDGNGVAIVSGDNQTRIFQVYNEAKDLIVTLSNMGIVDGKNASNKLGGAIYNNGEDLTLANCLFGGNANTFAGGQGGAIYSSGTLSVTNCVFQNNTASEENDIYSTNGEVITE